LTPISAAQFTGSDVGTYGGPTTAPGASTGCYGSNGNTGLPAGFDGGTTGHWDWPASPVADPYAGVPAAAGMKTVTRDQVGERLLHSCGGGDRWLSRPEPHQLLWRGPPNYPLRGCKEYAPGYYPSGISENGNDVITFLPGVYYMDGNLAIGGSDSIRMAKPCANSTGVITGTTYCSYLTKTPGPTAPEGAELGPGTRPTGSCSTFTGRRRR